MNVQTVFMILLYIYGVCVGYILRSEIYREKLRSQGNEEE